MQEIIQSFMMNYTSQVHFLFLSFKTSRAFCHLFFSDEMKFDTSSRRSATFHVEEKYFISFSFLLY